MPWSLATLLAIKISSPSAWELRMLQPNPVAQRRRWWRSWLPRALISPVRTVVVGRRLLEAARPSAQAREQESMGRMRLTCLHACRGYTGQPFRATARWSNCACLWAQTLKSRPDSRVAQLRVSLPTLELDNLRTSGAARPYRLGSLAWSEGLRGYEGLGTVLWPGCGARAGGQK